MSFDGEIYGEIYVVKSDLRIFYMLALPLEEGAATANACDMASGTASGDTGGPMLLTMRMAVNSGISPEECTSASSIRPSISAQNSGTG
jgi:hypothetical protein